MAWDQFKKESAGFNERFEKLNEEAWDKASRGERSYGELPNGLFGQLPYGMPVARGQRPSKKIE